MPSEQYGDLAAHERLLISDVDGTLLDAGMAHECCAELGARLRGSRAGLVLATGRGLPLTLNACRTLTEAGLPTPAALVCSVGSEIYLGRDPVPDREWARHIGNGWDGAGVKAVLDALPGLALQSAAGQGPFKVSYEFSETHQHAWRMVTAGAADALEAAGVPARLIPSAGRFLDVLPRRASKGAAALWLIERSGIDPSRVIVAGDSGNDREMLSAEHETGPLRAVIVGNRDPELDDLAGLQHVHPAALPTCAGVLEGLLAHGW